MPLTSWTCDTCGDLIDDPARGLVTWRDAVGDSPPRAATDFQIVHKNMEGRSCDPGASAGYLQSIELKSMLGPAGQARLLALLTAGPLKGEPGPTVAVADFDSFVDVFRRLHTEWYEEARPHFADPQTAARLDDANEVYPYLPEVLKRIATDTLGA